MGIHKLAPPVLPLSDPAAETHQETDDGTNQKDDEQNLGNAGGADRYAAESEKRRYQGDDEKHHCIVKHERTFLD
jgi:hypothetical protein